MERAPAAGVPLYVRTKEYGTSSVNRKPGNQAAVDPRPAVGGTGDTGVQLGGHGEGHGDTGEQLRSKSPKVYTGTSERIRMYRQK